MNCFFRCFRGGGPKARRRRRSSKWTSPPNLACRVPPFDEFHKPPPSTRFLPGGFAKKPALEQQVSEGHGSPLSLRENHEMGTPVCGRKKVTFDMNVKTYEEVANDEDPKYSVDVVNGGTIGETELPEAGNKFSSAFPINHRYQNCDCADEDDIGDEYEDCDTDEQEYRSGVEDDEEESYDSFFRKSVKKGPGNSYEASCGQMMRMSFSERQATISVNSDVHDWCQYANSLNSMEDILAHKEFEVCAAPIKNPGKENMNSELKNEMRCNSRPVLGVKMPTKAPNLSTRQEIPLAASLSSWLASSDNSTSEGPQKTYSHRSHSSTSREERSILGALTVEGITQSSCVPSSRRFQRGSPDEIPILGTVGSYWNCQNLVVDSASDMRRIPNTTGK